MNVNVNAEDWWYRAKGLQLCDANPIRYFFFDVDDAQRSVAVVGGEVCVCATIPYTQPERSSFFSLSLSLSRPICPLVGLKNTPKNVSLPPGLLPGEIQFGQKFRNIPFNLQQPAHAVRDAGAGPGWLAHYSIINSFSTLPSLYAAFSMKYFLMSLSLLHLFVIAL